MLSLCFIYGDITQSNDRRIMSIQKTNIKYITWRHNTVFLTNIAKGLLQIYPQNIIKLLGSTDNDFGEWPQDSKWT